MTSVMSRVSAETFAQACAKAKEEPLANLARRVAETLGAPTFAVQHHVAHVAACMADYEGHRGWIHCLAVSPVFQRNTYATAVMKTAGNRFREAGCPKINLQIRENNVNVCRFYVKIGFALDCVVSMGKRIDPE